MQILECRIIATDPALIELVLATDRQQPPEPGAGTWRIQSPPDENEQELEGWVFSTRGVPITGGYRYSLRAGPQANTDWIEPGAHVRLVASFKGEQPAKGKAEVGDEAVKRSVIEPGPVGLSDAAQAVFDEGDAYIRRLDYAGVQRAGADLSGLRGGIEDLVGFPLITETTGTPGGGAGGTTGGQALVDTEIQRLLGRVPASDDVKSTLALLDRNTEVTEEDGVRRLAFVRNAHIVLADSGAGVTGRQAFLASLAKDTLESISPLAERVEQLAPRMDNPSLLEAARANFLAAATDATAEAGLAGGPIAPRARVLLTQSLDQLVLFGRELGVLQRAGGVDVPTRRNVVTPHDEDQFTTFLVILERWRVFHDAFRVYLGDRDRAENVFGAQGRANDFGLEFTLLDRTVEVIGEAVDELDAALMSVGIDRRERETMRLGDDEDDDDTTVADVMDWAQGFAEREVRPLIQQAGVRGAALLPPRLVALSGAVEQLRGDVLAPANGPSALGHPRVGVAVDKLLRELENARVRAVAARNVNPDLA